MLRKKRSGDLGLCLPVLSDAMTPTATDRAAG